MSANPCTYKGEYYRTLAEFARKNDIRSSVIYERQHLQRNYPELAFVSLEEYEINVDKVEKINTSRWKRKNIIVRKNTYHPPEIIELNQACNSW